MGAKRNTGEDAEGAKSQHRINCGEERYGRPDTQEQGAHMFYHETRLACHDYMVRMLSFLLIWRWFCVRGRRLCYQQSTHTSCRFIAQTLIKDTDFYRCRRVPGALVGTNRIMHELVEPCQRASSVFVASSKLGALCHSALCG